MKEISFNVRDLVLLSGWELAKRFVFPIRAFQKYLYRIYLQVTVMKIHPAALCSEWVTIIPH
jgi:hypothetical protein